MTLGRKNEECGQLSRFACQTFLNFEIAPICLTIAGSFTSTTVFARVAWAQQVIPAADGVGTIVIPEGNRLDIKGGTLSEDGANLFHSFESFGLSADQIADFLASPDIQNILGRVTGGDASIIDGLLQISNSNANLYLINPTGILFGPNVQLNLPGSFIATTATSVGFDENWFNIFDSNDYQLLIGTPDAFAFDLSEPGSVVNTGTLALGQEQSLMLLGGTVVNTGTLATSGGEVTITAVPGENIVRVSQENQLLSLDFETIDTATNLSETQFPQGFSPLTFPELLTGGAAPVTPDIVVDFDGTVRLSSTDTAIPAEPGVAVSSGDLDVSGNIGGAITVVGDRVGLVDGGLDASGINGGGTARIGGDYQGEGTVPNAVQTYVGPDSVINTSALVTGNAGQVIVWSDGTTAFSGEIIARGGETSGDGGFVEISGREGLTFDGDIDVESPHDAGGTILFDPRNIIVENGVGTDDNEILDDGEIFSSDVEEKDFVIGAETIKELSETQNSIIRLEARENITFNANDIVVSGGSDLFAQANDTITVNDNSSITIGSGALQFKAAEINLPGTENSILSTDEGSIRLLTINGSDQDIVVGSETIANSNSLNITPADLLALDQSSFGEITIGSQSSSGQLTIADDLTLVAPLVTFEMRGAGGSIQVQDVTIAVSRSLRFIADEIDLLGQENSIGLISDSSDPTSISLSPGSNDQSIRIAESNPDDSNSTSFLDITSEDLSVLNLVDSNGFDTVNIGLGNPGVNTGNIMVAGEFNLPGNLIITSGNQTDSIIIDEDLNIDGILQIIPEEQQAGIRIDNANITANELVYDNPISISGNSSLSIANDFSFSNELSVTGDASFSLTSDDNLTFNTNILSNNGATLDLELIADGDQDGIGVLLLDGASVNTGGGSFDGTGTEIRIDNASVIDTTGNDLENRGDISLIGVGANDVGTNHGISIQNDSLLTTQNDNITLTGQGGTNPGAINTDGIAIDSGSQLFSTGSGDIIFNGTGGAGGDAQGISIAAVGSSTIQTNDGNIILDGTAGVGNGDTIFGNHGILIEDDGVIESVGNGSITIDGTGGETINANNVGNAGVFLRGDATARTGNIEINGAGGTQTDLNGAVPTGNHHGVSIDNAEVSTAGEIDITGTGGIGQGSATSGSLGISIFDSNVTSTNNDITLTGRTDALSVGFANHGIGISNSQISAQGEGTISIDGSSDATNSGTEGFGNDGVSISNNSRVDSNSGPISITGVGGNGTADPIDGNQGIVLLGDSEIASVDGNIQLNGTGRGPGENDYNIWLGEFGRGNLQTTGTGSIFITSENTSSIGGDRIFLGDDSFVEASGSGDIYITSDEAALLSDTARITGNRNLFLQTLTLGLDISFGGTPTGNGLHFESNEFGTLQSQVAKVFVGDANSSNSISFNEDTTFTSALELLSSDITLNDSTVSTTGNSLTINRSDDVNINGSGSFTTNGGNIILQGTDINVAPEITLDASSSNGTGGLINVTATERSVSTGDLNSSGNSGGSITVEAVTEITAGAIDSSGSVGDGGNVSLDPIGDIQVESIDTQGGSNGSGGDVTVVTGQFFRSTGSFTDQNGIDASISTAGTTGNGDITIFHDGGARGVPFVVGDSSVNGTAAAITIGADNSILPVRSFPGSYFQGDISIITTDANNDQVFPELVIQPHDDTS